MVKLINLECIRLKGEANLKLEAVFVKHYTPNIKLAPKDGQLQSAEIPIVFYTPNKTKSFRGVNCFLICFPMN